MNLGVKWMNVLGYFVAIGMTALLTWMGCTAVTNDRGLKLVLSNMMVLTLTLTVINLYIRNGRYTRREISSGKFRGTYYNSMGGLEQKTLQLAIILGLSTLLIAVWKLPRILHILLPNT